MGLNRCPDRAKPKGKVANLSAKATGDCPGPSTCIQISSKILFLCILVLFRIHIDILATLISFLVLLSIYVVYLLTLIMDL